MAEARISNGGEGTEQLALPYEQAVEIATGDSRVRSVEQFDSLGLTASQITRASNGTYRGPNGRPIKTVEAEAVLAKADPTNFMLSPEEVAEARRTLSTLAEGKLPEGVKRDFNKGLSQQIKEERNVLEAQIALSYALRAREVSAARQRGQEARDKARGVRKELGLDSDSQRSAVQHELNDIYRRSYDKSLELLEDSVQQQIASLKGDKVVRHHMAEQIRMEARKTARTWADMQVQARKIQIEAAGGPAALPGLLKREAEERRAMEEASAARKAKEAREARAARKAAKEEEAKRKFKEHIGSGVSRAKPAQTREPINNGDSPKKPSYISSKDWWAMDGEQRRDIAGEHDKSLFGGAVVGPELPVSKEPEDAFDSPVGFDEWTPSTDRSDTFFSTDDVSPVDGEASQTDDNEEEIGNWLGDLYDQHKDSLEDEENPFAHLPPPPADTNTVKGDGASSSGQSEKPEKRRGKGFWNRRNKAVATFLGGIAIVAGVGVGIVSGALEGSHRGDVSATSVQSSTSYTATGTTEVNIGGVIGGESKTATTEAPSGDAVSQFNNSVSAQRVAIQSRARELGVKLSSEQVDSIIAARSDSLFTGSEENFNRYRSATPQKRLIISDSEILRAARQS